MKKRSVTAMNCEYCDSLLKEIPEGGTCPNQQLPAHLQQLKPQKTMLKVPEGYLSLAEDRICLNAKLPRVPRKNISIEYKKLYDVSYVPATNFLKGFLCLRDWENRHKPLPQSFWKKSIRDSLIWFSKKENEAFYDAYVFLKRIAQENSKKQ